jgi:hypothetical protein
MTSFSQYSVGQDKFTRTSTASIRPRFDPETRVDIALLGSAFFLQRFSLPFAGTRLALDLVPVAFILLHQFISGRLVIQYDRLLWFLAAGLAATCSLLLNLERASLTSYLLFLVLSSLLTFSRSSSPNQYRNTLQAFQFLVIILSCLSVVQFVGQFVVSPYQLMTLFGLIPPSLLDTNAHTSAIKGGSSLLRSNAIFLSEPSNLTQITALGILIEVLEFRRPRYLVGMVVGMLLAYTGAGLMTLAVFLPLAMLRHGKVAFSVTFIMAVAVGLFAAGIIDSSVFVSRTTELSTPGASGYGRFVGGFSVAANFFEKGSLQALLIGNGPGTKEQLNDVSHMGSYGWLKQLGEYGVIGSFIFICFLGSCLRRSRCPGLVLAAIIFTDFFISDFLITWTCTITIVLCTLHGPEVGPLQAEPPRIPRTRRRLTAIDWQPS